MALFGKIFEKKECAICGGAIGVLGNRKLSDGNMCKDCASKLSPYFSDRKVSTVAEIEEQLAYREENREAVREFNTTRTIGRGSKILIDEDAGKFMVASTRNYEQENPDVLDFSQITGIEIDVSESRREDKRKDKDGKSVSYNPARYFYSYKFTAIIRVNHPYFDTMRVALSPNSVGVNEGAAVPEARKPDPRQDIDYRELEDMGKELKRILTQARREARAKAAEAPKQAVTCPWCGATTMPDAHGCCEYCGGSLND